MSDRHKVYQFIVTVEGREGDDLDADERTRPIAGSANPRSQGLPATEHPWIARLTDKCG